ncbi:MAG: class I SAM-dependent methyltransferase [Clostridiales bacterium]|nr:class I SAM-dependent methyltransferase [Clostridiales bacterium]
MDDWYNENVCNLESTYLASDEPWKQSGFSGPEERWEKCRRVIADLITKSGTLLDIGCANGYLLECIMKWKRDEGICITPFGLDIGERLVRLAKERLPEFDANMLVGNAFDWRPPVRFDYVRTELVYVPEAYQKQYIERLRREFLTADGALLVCEYRSSKNDSRVPCVDEVLRGYGFDAAECRSAVYEGKELTRAVLLRRD